MSSRSLVRFTFLFAIAALFAAMVFAARADDAAPPDKGLVGRWNMASVGADGSTVPWVLHITETDGKMTGSLATDEGESPTIDFAATGSKVHFKAPYQGENYDIDPTLDGDTLNGTWSGGGDSGKTTGARVKN